MALSDAPNFGHNRRFLAGLAVGIYGFGKKNDASASKLTLLDLAEQTKLPQGSP